MNFFQLIFILITVCLLSAGQILFKLASDSIVLTVAGFLPSLFNLKFLIAIILYAIATVFWVLALKGASIVLVYPFAALSYFIVPFFSHFILGESVSWNTYIGASIIFFGVIVSVSGNS